MPGKQLDSLRGNMCLHAQAVVLVLERGLPHPLENLFEGLEALCEHRSDRAEQLEMNLIESVKSFRGEHAGDLSEVRRDVVGPFDPVSVHFRRKGGCERVHDRHVGHAESHLADDHPDDVFCLARRRVPEEVRQQADLPILAPFPCLTSNCIEVFVDLRGRQRRRFERLLPPRHDCLLRDEPEVSLLLP